MLTTICDDTWNVLNITAHKTQIRKDGIIQTPPLVAIKRLKDPPTWLKVVTTLERPPTPTHMAAYSSELFVSPYINGSMQDWYLHR